MSAPTEEPLSWRAIQWVKGVIAEISQDTGYYSNFAAVRMLDDRSQVDAEQGEYVLVIATDFDPTGESGGRTSHVYNEDMTMLIEFGIRKDPSLNPELAVHRARSDVLRALRTPLRNQKHGITSIEIENSSVGDAPDGSALIIAQVQARAGLSDTTPPAI